MKKTCPSGEAIPVWLMFLSEGANLQSPKGQKMYSENIKKITKEAIEQL
jgi:hypothetical protein